MGTLSSLQLIMFLLGAITIPTVTALIGLLMNRSEMGGFRSEVRSEIGGLRSEIGGLRSELHSGFGDLRSEVGNLRSELKADILRLEVKVDVLHTKFDGINRDLGRHDEAIGTLKTSKGAVIESIAASAAKKPGQR